MSPHCPERGQPKTKGTHQGSIAPVAIAHQGAIGKIKLGWVALELENIQLKGDLGACLDIHSQTQRFFLTQYISCEIDTGPLLHDNPPAPQTVNGVVLHLTSGPAASSPNTPQ